MNWAKLLGLREQQQFFQNSPPDVTPKTSPITPPKPQQGDLRIVTYGLDMWRVEEYTYIGHGATTWSSAYVHNSDHFSEVQAEKRIKEILTERMIKQDRQNQIAARAANFPPRTVPPYKYINGE